MHSKRLATYEAQRDQIDLAFVEADPFAVAPLDFGIAYERAVIEWFEKLRLG